ncbi:MAG: 23S rRNA (guanosine(2251)-2'-O)-methyltransferase RlmB [Steroidobacteraceae bacterium]
MNLVAVGGLHAVRALLERSPERVQKLLLDTRRDDQRIRELLQRATAAAVRVERVEARQLAGRVGEMAHQGVVAEVQPLAGWSEDDLFTALEGCATPPLVLVLDGVQDPHNLGACLRSADACGALTVVVPRDRAASVNATVRKVAAGAAETTPVTTVTNLARALKLMKEAGLWVAGADMAGEKLAWEADLKGPLALVMGGEGDGLRDLTRRSCDLLVRLPQVGAVESLNVSVASGMLLYEALRQRQG